MSHKQNDIYNEAQEEQALERISKAVETINDHSRYIKEIDEKIKRNKTMLQVAKLFWEG